MNRLCALVRKLYGHSFVRFAAVGGVATAVTYGTYVSLLHKFVNLSPAIAYVDQSFQRVGAARDMALGRGADTLCPAVCLCGRFPCQLLYGAIRLAREVTRSC